MMQNQENEYEEFPLANAIDAAILMHRDVHFGGSFDLMIDYYRKEGKGINSEFELNRIIELAEVERKTGNNLAAVTLSGADAEKVFRAKQMYLSLRKLYEKPSDETKYSRLIADLILSEEEEAEAEIGAIIKEKGAIVPFLITLLNTDDLYDPLFPGYGLAPALASKCLGVIGDKRAIISLFESIGGADLFTEEVAIDALHKIGNPAKQFLLKVLHGRPLNIDNERAAIALVAFKDDAEVSQACFAMLQDKEVREDLSLSTYLVLALEALAAPTDREAFRKMSKDPALAPSLRVDMKIIADAWK